ncbi:unnamed protein product [Dibothriocephalus latus]|uniref:Uncharacterized protein n=1 Tax=Dibothriocephalus latus TaxID=60516 RepID=A0A3P7P0Y5_DIBLA|nr:unnamed protein product [Dibothriocephalus latus]
MFPHLHTLAQHGVFYPLDNPVQRVPKYRMETLITVLTLRRLDKDNFAPEEVEEAKVAAERRREEEEAARATEEVKKAKKMKKAATK